MTKVSAKIVTAIVCILALAGGVASADPGSTAGGGLITTSNP